jgi:limonene-1,2-epoxide hydrolase
MNYALKLNGIQRQAFGQSRPLSRRLPPGRIAKESNQMVENNEKLVNNFCAAFARRNVDELMTYFTGDAVYDNVPAKPVKGMEAISQALKSYISAAQSVDFRVLRSLCSGNLVMNERLDVFEMGGKRVELPVVGVFEITDGKIALWRDYFDMATWTRQMK